MGTLTSCVGQALPNRLEHNKILLTGGTGIMGSYLLKCLLEETSAEIFCLVRAETEAQALERLCGSLRIYEPTFDWEEFPRRVRPLLGDVASHCLGLLPQEYEQLTQTIDTTLHVAALTDLFLSYRRIEPVNLGGARNIVDFCLKTRQKYLCHVSTHTVMGDKTFDKSVIFRETDLDIGQGFDHMTYQHTKFLAELMIRDARHRGLVWNIFRPGQIFGDSRTGRYPLGQSQITGLFYDIFKTVTETRLALFSHTHFDVVPVDYVSRAVIELGFRRNSFYETYHLTNPDRKTYSEVIDLVSKQGYPIEVVPQEEYRRRLLNREVTRDGVEYKSATTQAFRWWYKREIDFYYSAITDCEYTRAQLAQTGIHCPPCDQKLIGTYIDEGIRRGYFMERGRKSAPAAEPASREVELSV